MSELQDHSELVRYSIAVLYICSAIAPPQEDLATITELLIDATSSAVCIFAVCDRIGHDLMICSLQSWRIRSNALPILITFFFRNFMSMEQKMISRVADVLLECLADENVEVREIAALTLSTLVRCSERQRIGPLKASEVRGVPVDDHNDVPFRLASFNLCGERVFRIVEMRSTTKRCALFILQSLGCAL